MFWQEIKSRYLKLFCSSVTITLPSALKIHVHQQPPESGRKGCRMKDPQIKQIPALENFSFPEGFMFSSQGQTTVALQLNTSEIHTFTSPRKGLLQKVAKYACNSLKKKKISNFTLVNHTVCGKMFCLDYWKQTSSQTHMASTPRWCSLTSSTVCSFGYHNKRT